MPSADFLAAFERAMQTHGLTPTTPIVADGELHRFHVEGDKRGSRNGWYCLHGDDPPSGAFGSWRNGETHKWCAISDDDLTPDDRRAFRERIEAAKRQRDTERARLAAEASERAAGIWQDGDRAESHPYLDRKGVGPHGARLHHDGRLILPVLNLESGEPRGVQYISGDGEKRFMPGTAKRGHGFVIGELDGTQTLIIVEGFATGASIHEATGHPVIVGFDAGNLKPVAEVMRRLHPDAAIIIGADHDANGVGQAKAREAAQAVNGRVAIPPEPGDWNDHAAAHGLDAVRTAFETPTAVEVDRPECLMRTEAAAAERFARANGGDIKHSSTLGWLVWDGKRWKRDGKAAFTMAQDKRRGLAALTLAELHNRGVVSAQEAAAWYSFARRLEGRSATDGVLALASALPAMNADPIEFDADPWALNCASGTIDLRTGTLRPHKRDDFLTMLSPARFEPGADCPAWRAHLDLVFGGDAALVDYFQWLCGYCLTGSTKHQLFAIMHGPPMTGKSTTLTALMDVLGEEYTLSLDPEAVMMQAHARHSCEIAALRGVRLVSIQETAEGRRLNEGLVKTMTGGDRMTARFMRMDPFCFDPTHKLMLATNHKPVVRDDSGAMHRRIRLIPFVEKVTPERRIGDLRERLAAEAPGILAWMVAGAVRAAQDEPELPAAVRAANEEYAAESDVIGAFLEECCIIGPHETVSKARLYAIYTAWTGGKALGRNTFNRKIEGRGFDSGKDRTGHFWIGIGVENGDA